MILCISDTYLIHLSISDNLESSTSNALIILWKSITALSLSCYLNTSLVAKSSQQVLTLPYMYVCYVWKCTKHNSTPIYMLIYLMHSSFGYQLEVFIVFVFLLLILRDGADAVVD